MEQVSILENEARLPKHIQSLRNLVLNDADLNSCLDDEFLKRFIRARKYNTIQAAKQVRKFWEFKESCPELTDGLYPTNFRGIFEPLYSVGKNRSDGRHVFFFRFGSWDLSKITLDQITASIFLVIDHMASEQETQLNGIIILIDFSDLTWRHVMNTTPKRLKQMTQFIQGVFPARFKGFHFINNPSIANILYAIIKPLLKQKMRDRFVFHGYNYEESIRNAFGAHVLPESLGGILPNDAYEDKNFFPNLYKLDKHYKKLMSYGLHRL